MQYLCERQLVLGGSTYNPGDIIPDGVVLDSRAGKLENSGYISVIRNTQPLPYSSMASLPHSGEVAMYTQEEVDQIVAEAIGEAVNNTVIEMEQKQQELQQAAARLQEYSGSPVQAAVMVEAFGDNAQATVIPASPEEIKQVFSIMQMNAEDGAKEIAGVTSDNVLVLLHAADSRKTIKNAAKEQAGKLQHMDVPPGTGCGSIAGSDAEGDGA